MNQLVRELFPETGPMQKPIQTGHLENVFAMSNKAVIEKPKEFFGQMLYFVPLECCHGSLVVHTSVPGEPNVQATKLGRIR